jgi:hypothetical protein
MPTIAASSTSGSAKIGRNRTLFSGAYVENFQILTNVVDNKESITLRVTAEHVYAGLTAEKQGSSQACGIAQLGLDMLGSTSRPWVSEKVGFSVTDRKTPGMVHPKRFEFDIELIDGEFDPVAFDKVARGQSEEKLRAIAAELAGLITLKHGKYHNAEVRSEPREAQIARNVEYRDSGRKAKAPSSKRSHKLAKGEARQVIRSWGAGA